MSKITPFLRYRDKTHRKGVTLYEKAFCTVGSRNCLLSSLGDDPDYFRTHVTVSFDDFGEAITETTATMYFKCTFKYGGYYMPALYSEGHVNAVQVSYVTKAN